MIYPSPSPAGRLSLSGCRRAARRRPPRLMSMRWHATAPLLAVLSPPRRCPLVVRLVVRAARQIGVKTTIRFVAVLLHHLNSLSDPNRNPRGWGCMHGNGCSSIESSYRRHAVLVTVHVPVSAELTRAVPASSLRMCWSHHLATPQCALPRRRLFARDGYQNTPFGSILEVV